MVMAAMRMREIWTGEDWKSAIKIKSKKIEYTLTKNYRKKPITVHDHHWKGKDS